MSKHIEDDTRPFEGRELRTLDDIPREIADRRIHAEFGDSIAPESSRTLREQPDRIETAAEFRDAAHAAGIENTEGVLGWSTNLESPAHIRRDEVGREIATLIHEDLHRLTHAETMREMTADPARRDLYEGITEALTDRAADGLHGHTPGECYPGETRRAELLAGEIGDEKLRDYFFRNEMDEDIQKAIERLSRPEPER